MVPDPAAVKAGAFKEADVAKWMEGKVVRYKWLKGGVKFVQEIPKNPVSFFTAPSLSLSRAVLRSCPFTFCLIRERWSMQGKTKKGVRS